MINWLNQVDLDQAVNDLKKNMQSAYKQAAQRRQRNVVDPFASLLVASTFKLSNINHLNKILNTQSTIQGIANALGLFHQQILSSIDGWHNCDAGYDLECPNRQILAEIKNKHNTMNASNQRQVISDLKTALKGKKNSWQGYLVIIIPKTPQRYEKLLDSKLHLYEIDGASFYYKASGEPNALHELFEYLVNAFESPNDIVQYCRKVLNQNLPPKM